MIDGSWTRRGLRTLGVVGAATLALALSSASAGAATATATFTAGSLAFVSAPPNVTFNDTLNGTNQTATATQALDVSDATGSGAGWSLSATSTTFSTGGGTPILLATNATTIASGPTRACDSGSTCTLATNSVSYPYTLPAAASAPTATKMFNAAVNTGEGNETVTVTWSLAIPATTQPGTYTSTWTISLASGP